MAKAQISHLDNAYTRAQQVERDQQAARNRRRQIHRRRRVILVAVLVLVLVGGGVQLWRLHQAQVQATARVATAKKQLHKVTTKQKNLQIQVNELNNADYLEKLIRAKYYMSKSGETIFNIPDSDDSIPGDK